jgi:hypothetical protein
VMPTLVLMDMVLMDQFRFINRNPAQDPSLQGVGFFHVRGTSCVDERYWSQPRTTAG